MELANRESSIAWKLHHLIHDRVKVFVCTDIYGYYHLRKYILIWIYVYCVTYI